MNLSLFLVFQCLMAVSDLIQMSFVGNYFWKESFPLIEVCPRLSMDQAMSFEERVAVGRRIELDPSCPNWLAYYSVDFDDYCCCYFGYAYDSVDYHHHNPIKTRR